MLSNFKALLVAGVALPALVGVAFAQGVTTNNSVTPSAPSVKSETAVTTPSVKADTKVAPTGGKADVNAGSSSKPETKIDSSAKAGTTAAVPNVDGKAVEKKTVPGKTSEIAPKSDATKMSVVKQNHLKKHDIEKTSAASSASPSTIARGPVTQPKAGGIATPGSAAQKL
jgi:hypothetical protein